MVIRERGDFPIPEGLQTELLRGVQATPCGSTSCGLLSWPSCRQRGHPLSIEGGGEAGGAGQRCRQRLQLAWARSELSTRRGKGAGRCVMHALRKPRCPLTRGHRSTGEAARFIQMLTRNTQTGERIGEAASLPSVLGKAMTGTHSWLPPGTETREAGRLAQD